MEKIKNFFSKAGIFLHNEIMRERNRKRDVIILLMAVLISRGILLSNNFFAKEKGKGNNYKKESFDWGEISQVKAASNKPEEVTKVVEKNDNITQQNEYKIAESEVITAPMPRTYKEDTLGRLVCDKENDHPKKSDQGKGRHMDMECCMDPDEYPNPHCYYDSDKYGKYL